LKSFFADARFLYDAERQEFTALNFARTILLKYPAPAISS
jgi:hypothetical protein